MAFTTGNYQGLTAADYNTLMQLDWFKDEWANNFTQVDAGDGYVYLFTADDSGEDMDFLGALVDNDLENIELGYYVYILSTQSVSGF